MENPFIILHRLTDNSPVIVNISQIENIQKTSIQNSKNGSDIFFIINEEIVRVNESVEKIMNIINEKSVSSSKWDIPEDFIRMFKKISDEKEQKGKRLNS